MTRPAAGRSLIRAHTLMDSEPLMTPDEISVTEVGTVKAVALPVPELSGLLLYKAPAAGNTDRQLDQMADARK
jgi:hypothetical protein